MNIYKSFLAIFVGGAVGGQAQTILSTDHIDIAIIYTPGMATNRLTLAAYDDEHQTSYSSNEAVLLVGDKARFELPDGTPFGKGGDPLWILPQSPYEGILLLGHSTESIPLGSFTGPLSFNLVGVEMPGRTTRSEPRFYVWQTGPSGDFNMVMNSADGITASDRVHLSESAHAHYNWGFSTPGLWHLTLEAEGKLVGEGTNIRSEPVTFAFHVLPLQPFEQWQSTNWPAATPQSIIGAHADPDGDGIDNLLEYGLGLDPQFSSRNGLPQIRIVEAGEQRYAAITYTELSYATDLVYEVLVAETLSNPVWHPLTTVYLVTNQSDRKTITLRDTIPLNSAPNRFYTLRVALKSSMF